MDLYVDGNIAQMFSPEGATCYFARLLGVDARSLRPTVMVSHELPHAFFITTPPLLTSVQNARPSLDINRRPIDYAISQAGTIVPQRRQSSGNASDKRQPNVSLNMPIFFVHQNDRLTLGLPLLSAVAVKRHGGHVTLLGAGDTAPIRNCSTTYIRINVIFSLNDCASLFVQGLCC
jgi:hypothetical protein